MRYFFLFLCLLLIVIIELMMNNFWDGIKEMLSNTNPIVGFVLFIIYLEIFVIAKKELKQLKDSFKKFWGNK